MVLFSFIACKKNNPTPTPPVVVPPVTNLVSLPKGWKLASAYMTAFPTGIQVYQFDSVYGSNKLKAFCLAYDSKNTNFEFKPIMSATAKTVSAFANTEPGTTYACINGGYFGGSQSFSLVKYANAVQSANIKAVTRTYNGGNVSYYPTRAAFGVNSSGAPSVAWVYNVGAGNDLIYSYPSPAPNDNANAPLPVPTETFPTGGTVWNTSAAIGGSPVLIKNGVTKITDVEELISINNTTSRPRSAIGYTSTGIVIIMAIEGDNAPYNGANLAETAAIMNDFGCTEAINLDGGGSTSFIINNTRTVYPNGGSERPVISAVLIKKR